MSTVVSVAGALITTIVISVLADASGWGSFGLSLGSLKIFAFNKQEAGFSTDLGDGLYLLALLAGITSGIVTAVRMYRSTISSVGPKGA